MVPVCGVSERSMISGVVNTARTLSYYLRRQEVVAANLANMSTVAFKPTRATAHAGADGAPEISTRADWSQGLLRQTGRTFDVALEGAGFLVVDSGRGDRMTRGGGLQLDDSGRLTDAAGHPLLGEQGPIYLNGQTLDIDPDGSLRVDGQDAGKLKLVTVPDLDRLRVEGDGLYAGDEPATPALPGSLRVRQGHLEDPNVDPVLSLVDMIAVQRAYAANVQVLKAMDRVMGINSTEVGDA